MGRKYGSVHIRITKNHVTPEAVAVAYNALMDAAFPGDVKTVAGRLGLSIDPGQLPFLNSLVSIGMAESRKYETVEHNGFVSLYDKYLTFENIESAARRLSASVGEKVLFASVYDDSLFLFGLCENGATIAVSASGDCGAYDIPCESRNIEAIEEYLSSGAHSLRGLSGADMERALMKILGFQLNPESCP